MNYFWSNRYTALYLLLLVSLVLLAGEIVNGRFWMHDLEVYYKTAARFVSGSELYRIKADGHYVYKYSPPAAGYFIPFLVLPFGVAKAVYWLLLTFVTALVFHKFYQFMLSPDVPAPGNKHKNIVLCLAFLTVGAHIHREWHLGQVNLLLLGIYTLIVESLIYEKRLKTGLLLALSLFIKPFGLIFYPYLLLKKRYTEVLYSCIFILLLGLLPLLFYPSVGEFKQLYLSWFQELAIELRAKQDLLADANHTIFSVGARYTPLQYLLTNAAAIKIYQLGMLAGLGSIVLGYIRMGRNLPENTTAEVSFLIACIPLLAFTSENAFLFTAPCIILVLYRINQFSTRATLLIILGCLLIGGNIRDLVGSRLFGYLNAISVYTFGTLLLLGLVVILRRTNIKNGAPPNISLS